MKTTIALAIILALGAAAPAATSATPPGPSTARTTAKLHLLIEKVEFKNAKLGDVLGYLSTQAHINIVFDASALQFLAAPKQASPQERTRPTRPRTDLITIRLHNVPLGEVLKYVLRTKGLTYIVEEYAILIVPIGTVPSEELITTVFRLSSHTAFKSAKHRR